MKDYVDQTANIDVGFVEELQVTGRSVAGQLPSGAL